MVSAIDRAKRALIALVKTLAAVYNVVISRRRRRFRYRPPVHVARRRCCWSSFLSVVVVSVVVARRPSSSVAFVVGRRCAKSHMRVTKVPWIFAIVFHFGFCLPLLLFILISPHHPPKTIVFN